MGKRSNFERRERDFYPTPRSAVLPLLRHLPGGLKYFEPCAGDGALIRALPAGTCVGSCDIDPAVDWIAKKNAIGLTEYDMAGVDAIITNPPWDRKVLHLIITHLSDLRPTWLLFDADWVHTKQAAPFLPRLRKIVSVGRVKWIPDSKMTGKDNCAWHLFDVPSGAGTLFYGRSVSE